MLNYESGHSRLATGFEKQPVKFEFRFFILAGSYAAVAVIGRREFTKRSVSAYRVDLSLLRVPTGVVVPFQKVA